MAEEIPKLPNPNPKVGSFTLNQSSRNVFPSKKHPLNRIRLNQSIRNVHVIPSTDEFAKYDHICTSIFFIQQICTFT